MTAQDEATTKAPLTGSRWKHNESGEEYSVEGERKVKFDGTWHNGVDYEALGDGGKYWRTFKDFYKNFTEVT
jgi:hypothetical protein